MKRLLLAALAMGVATGAQAHEVWIERSGDGPARIFLGEPENPRFPDGDPQFPKLKAPKLVPASTAKQTRGAGYIEVAAPKGDVRAWDDNIFAPWDEEGKKNGVIYYARAGRSETRGVMPFELVPVTANGTKFVLMKDGKPAPKVTVRLLTPDRWMKNVDTDANGVVELPIRESGLYILHASVKDDRPTDLPNGKVDVLHRTTTTSFMAP